MNFLDLDLILISLRTLPWQPILDKICEMTFIQHAGFHNRFKYRNADLKVLKVLIFRTFCAILVKTVH